MIDPYWLQIVMVTIFLCNRSAHTSPLNSPWDTHWGNFLATSPQRTPLHIVVHNHFTMTSNAKIPFLASLNLSDLSKLTNGPIANGQNSPAISAKLPSHIPKFEGKQDEDPGNHVMTFHLWCSSNSVIENNIRLWLFQRTLTRPATKWYVDQSFASQENFSSLATAFLTLFHLPVCHDSNLELLRNFKQTRTTHISDHLHEWQKFHSLCKTQYEDKVLLDIFLRSLTSEISKDVENSSPQTEEETVSKAQHLELIYTQSGYIYHVLPDALRLQD